MKFVINLNQNDSLSQQLVNNKFKSENNTTNSENVNPDNWYDPLGRPFHPSLIGGEIK